MFPKNQTPTKPNEPRGREGGYARRGRKWGSLYLGDQRSMPGGLGGVFGIGLVGANTVILLLLSADWVRRSIEFRVASIEFRGQNGWGIARRGWAFLSLGLAGGLGWSMGWVFFYAFFIRSLL